MKKVNCPVFTADQRCTLVRHGLLPEQIEQLQCSLTSIRGWLMKPPPLSKIRAHIRTISKPLAKSCEELGKLESAAYAEFGPNGPSIECIVPPHVRKSESVLLNAVDVLAAWELLGIETASELRRLAEKVSGIDAQLTRRANSKGQRVISWRPIAVIQNALFEGWRKHQQLAGRGKVRRNDDVVPPNPLPRYEPLTVSNSGAFGEIAQVCFEALGKYSSPERAIRSYQNWMDTKQRLRIEERRRLSETLPEGDKYRPLDLAAKPRKRGRPVKAK